MASNELGVQEISHHVTVKRQFILVESKENLIKFRFVEPRLR